MIRFIRDIFATAQSDPPPGRLVRVLSRPRPMKASGRCSRRRFPRCVTLEPGLLLGHLRRRRRHPREDARRSSTGFSASSEITAMAHLTCVNATIDETRAVLEQTRALGIKNILALRGDPPNGAASSSRPKAASSTRISWCDASASSASSPIGVAGFPEGHIACKEGKHVDWQRLKQKIDQRRRLRDHAAVLRQPPLLRVPRLPAPARASRCRSCRASCRFSAPRRSSGSSALCGAELPAPLLSELERRGDDDEAVSQFGIDYATTQCEELLREGRARPSLLHAQQSPIHDRSREEPRARSARLRRGGIDRLSHSREPISEPQHISLVARPFQGRDLAELGDLRPCRPCALARSLLRQIKKEVRA